MNRTGRRVTPAGLGLFFSYDRFFGINFGIRCIPASSSQVPRKGITPWFPRGLSLGAGRGTRTLDLQHGKLSL